MKEKRRETMKGKMKEKMKREREMKDIMFFFFFKKCFKALKPAR